MLGGIIGISAFPVSSQKKYGESALFIFFLTGYTEVITSPFFFFFLPGFFQLPVTIRATFYSSLRKERSGRYK